MAGLYETHDRAIDTGKTSQEVTELLAARAADRVPTISSQNLLHHLPGLD